MVLTVTVEEGTPRLDVGQREKDVQIPVRPWAAVSGWMTLLHWQCGTEGALSSPARGVCFRLPH